MSQPISENDPYLEHPLYNGTTLELRSLKTILRPLGFLSQKPDTISELLDIADIQKLTRLAVLQHLDKKILNGTTEEKNQARDFITTASLRISKRVGVEREPKKSTKKKHPRITSIVEEEQLDEVIIEAISQYNSVLIKLPGVRVLDAEKAKEAITQEKIKGLVILGVKKALGWNPQEPLVKDAIQRVTQKIVSLQKISESSGFYKLPHTHKEIIVKNENFGIGFDMIDIEKIGYSSIRKFTPQALKLFLDSLRVSDEARYDKIEDMARNIVGVQAVTEEMILKSSEGYEMVRVDS